jgi:hypothetical protein
LQLLFDEGATAVIPIGYAIQTTDAQRSVYWKYVDTDTIVLPGGVSTALAQFAYIFSNLNNPAGNAPAPASDNTYWWVYHINLNIWFKVDQDNYLRVVYAQRNVQVTIDNSPDLSGTQGAIKPNYIQRSAVDNRKTTFTDGNYELVKERAPPGSGTPTGNNLVVWLPNATSGQWVSIDPNSLVAGHWEASSTPWYFYRASDLYTVCMYYNSANVVVTGHVAVSVSNTDGSRTWRHGILFPYSFASNRFLSTLKNTGITDPPNPLDGYTLQSDYRWAYNLDQQIWYEISTDSYTDVTISGTTGSITYESDSPLPLLPKLNTMVDGTSSAAIGTIEIIWGRTPENATVPATSLNWFMLTVLGKTVGMYGTASITEVAAYTLSTTNGVKNRTNAAGLQVWDVANSCWKAIDRLQVICEPFTSGNTVKWRPNLPMEILNRLISNGLSAPVTYTGNAILPGVKPGTSGAAPQWCTGRTFLGTDNQPSNFSYIMGNYNNSGSILIQGPPSAPTSNIGWAFHQRQRIWCDIANEESYARIQLWNLSSNADGLNLYYIADTPVSSVYIQKTVANNGGTSTTEGNVEVLWYRSGNYVAPLPESLRFMDQTSGVSTDDTGTVFSSTKAAINAYQTNRTRQSIRTVWSSNAQDWRVLDVDQVLWEPFTSGNVTKWRMNTLDNIRMNATTRPIGDPVNYTGYVAVLSTDFADQVQWRLGRSYLDHVATPANFSVVLPNYPQPISQAGKPTTIIPITLEFPPSSNIQSDTPVFLLSLISVQKLLAEF